MNRLAAIRMAYGAVGVAITPLLYAWLYRRAQRGKEDPLRRRERFGYASVARPSGKLVWLHAASVGEAQSVRTLMRILLKHHPSIHLLITTGTVTSAALIAKEAMPRVIHQFIPIDTHPAVRRFFNHWQPDLALWVESEFWPGLLWHAQNHHLPMLLINARMSERSFARWQRWPTTIASLLHSFCRIYAGSSADADRLQSLGGSDIHEIGNIKFDAPALAIDPLLAADLARDTQGRKLLLAASTHANEEQMIAQIHGDVAQQIPNLLTIIVPRHATRGASISADLRAQGIIVSQRSMGEAITAQTQIYLADTMGELGNFYAIADVVFMGGSLVAHGGQNPLEPARQLKALITGPHTHNFAAIMAQLSDARAIETVTDIEALAACVRRLLMDDTARQAMGARAYEYAQHAQGASQMIAQHCRRYLDHPDEEGQ